MTKNKKVDLSLVDFVVSEFAMNPKVPHGHFRRLVQLALLPRNGEKPSLVPKQISEQTGETSQSIAQTLANLEKTGLVMRVEGTNGAYQINRNRAEWFPEDMSEAEKGIKKELELLEQLKVETMEKLKAIKNSNGGAK